MSSQPAPGAAVSGEKEPDPVVAAARRQLAAVASIIDILEPLTPERRKATFAAVLCTEYPECADAAIAAFVRKRTP